MTTNNQERRILDILIQNDEIPPFTSLQRIYTNIRYFLTRNRRILQTPKTDEELLDLWICWSDDQNRLYTEDPLTSYYGIGQ